MRGGAGSRQEDTKALSITQGRGPMTWGSLGEMSLYFPRFSSQGDVKLTLRILLLQGFPANKQQSQTPNPGLISKHPPKLC